MKLYSKIIEDLKQKNSDLEALNKKNTEMLQNERNKCELEKKKLRDTIKRLDSPDYKNLGKIKRNQSDDKLKISSEKLRFVRDVISNLKRFAQEKLNRFRSAPSVQNDKPDDIYNTKFSNILEKICDECDVITEKLDERSTLDYSVVSKLETTIESLQPEIERLSGGLEIDCALCKQSLVFPKCTKCNQIFHGECVHRTFVDKNSPSCCFCTNKQSIALAFEFVPVQQSANLS
ncbi:hypothetical protein CAEBREN_18929 [Caenorhabditis brenneri]|uniref:Uncharacterized protein n=1 Tax=Caenorhabditis brenneri TaxID=135651 RepID=G0MXA0_CAEBE|nr:hypothetical protein CAEBREN_18929 [Caenorhabditis brenneri]